MRPRHTVFFFVPRTVGDSSSPNSLILKARPEEIAFICRRSEHHSSAIGGVLDYEIIDSKEMILSV